MAGMDAVKLFFDLIGRTQGERDIDRFARSVQNVGDEGTKTSKKLGELSKGSRALADDLAKAQRHVAELRAEFAKTGDMGLLKEITKGERDVKRLSAWMKQFGDDGSRNVGLVGAAFRLASQGAKSLMDSLDSVPAQAKVALAAVAVGAATVIGPTLLAAVSGAILAGAGLGVAGLGAVIMSSSPTVTRAFSKMASDVQRILRAAAQPLAGPFVNVATRITGIVRDIAPMLNRAFSTVAPSIDKLMVGFSGLANNAMAGFTKAVEGARPVLDMLAAKLPEIGTAFGDFFARIGGAGPGAMKALAFMIDVLNAALEHLGKILAGASKWFDWISKVPGNAAIMDSLTGASDRAASAQLSFGVASESSATAVDHVSESISDVIAKMDELGGKVLSTRDAQRGFQAAVDAAKQSLKDNGKTLADNTQKGRDNGVALDAIASKTFSLRAAQAAQNASQHVLNATLERGYGASVKAAMGYGQTAKQAINYAKAVYGVPPSRQTLLQMLGVAKSASDIAYIKSLLAQLHGKQVYVDIVTRYSGKGTGSANAAEHLYAAGGPVRRFAGGGYNGPVRGPGSSTSDSIPAMLSNGEYVIKAASARKAGVPALDFLNRTGAMPVGGGGSVMNLTVNVNAPHANPAEVGRKTVEAIKEYERRSGKGWRS